MHCTSAVRTSGMHCTSAVRTSGMHCTSTRIFWCALHFRVTSVVVQLLVVHHRHSQLSVTQLLVVCCTGRVSSGLSSLASAYRLSNTPLPLVVWAICAALFSRGGHRGINEDNFSQSGDDYKFFKRNKRKRKKKIQVVQSELQPASSTPLA